MEMPLNTGGQPDHIDRSIRQRFADRDHPMGDLPQYPTHVGIEDTDPSSFEELVASEQYQDTVQKLANYAQRHLGIENAHQQHPMQLMGMFMGAVQEIAQIERPHREQLKEMAINLVFSMPEFKAWKQAYEDGEFRIDFQFQDQVAPLDLGGDDDDFGGEEQEAEENAFEVAQDFDPEVAKRRFINAMIQGNSLHKHYAFHIIDDQISEIDERLPNLYGFVNSFSELLYFVMPHDQQMQAHGNAPPAGSEELDWEGDTPVVRVRAVNFPVAVQELVKGLMELGSVGGLPGDPRAQAHVVDQERQDGEIYSIIMGRGLWKRFLDQLDMDDHELAMFVYDKLVQLPAEEFSKAMREIQAGGGYAKKIITQIVNEIKAEHDAENSDDDYDDGYGDMDDEEPQYESARFPGTRFYIDHMITEATLKPDKINQLKKRFAKHNMDEETIVRVAELDPTPKGTYTEWLIKMHLEQKFVLGEDDEDVKNTLLSFSRIVNKPKFTGSRNILSYDAPGDLQDAVDEFSGGGVAGRAGGVTLHPIEARKYTANTNPFGKEWDKTSWCVRPGYGSGSMYNSYASKEKYWLYFKKHDQPYVLIAPNGGHAMDTRDRPIDRATSEELSAVLKGTQYADLIKFHGNTAQLWAALNPDKDPMEGITDPNELMKMAKKLGRQLTPESLARVVASFRDGAVRVDDMVSFCIETGTQLKEVEDHITSPDYDGWQQDNQIKKYAKNVLKGRFPRGEEIILGKVRSSRGNNAANSAIDYASEVIQGRWQELETLLIENSDAENTQSMIDYANKVVRGRWDAFEQYLDKINPSTITSYAKVVVEGKGWPEGDAEMIRRADSNELYEYAKDVKKGEWPEAEPAMLARPAVGLADYAIEFKGADWPEADAVFSSPDCPDPLAGHTYMAARKSGRHPEYEERLIEIVNTVDSTEKAKRVMNKVMLYVNDQNVGKWPPFEQFLFNLDRNDPNQRKLQYLVAYHYAKAAIKGKWPEGEELMRGTKVWDMYLDI